MKISHIVIAAALLAAFLLPANATDNGQYANSALKQWFDHLASGKGLCCSITDGKTVSDVDWGTHEGHFFVILDGVRYRVPDEAVITEPNKFGPAVVWPYTDEQGNIQIRCFLKGAEG